MKRFLRVWPLAYVVGFDTGGEISLAVGRHAAITGGYRYFGGPGVDVAVSPTTVLNAEELAFEPSIADLTSWLALTALRDKALKRIAALETSP